MRLIVGGDGAGVSNGCNYQTGGGSGGVSMDRCTGISSSGKSDGSVDGTGVSSGCSAVTGGSGGVSIDHCTGISNGGRGDGVGVSSGCSDVTGRRSGGVSIYHFSIGSGGRGDGKGDGVGVSSGCRDVNGGGSGVSCGLYHRSYPQRSVGVVVLIVMSLIVVLLPDMTWLH